MAKFCSNCGKELNEEQDVCLGCGKVVSKQESIQVIEKKKDTNHSTYKTTTGIVMIVLGFCLICASGSETMYDNALLVYTLPGIFGLLGGILNLNTKKNPDLLIPAAVIMFLGAVFNFIGILDISIFTIIAVIFGIFNIKYSKQENKKDN